ncbi:helicase-exonuclease AddAB subunit AddA [Brevibacillus ginsengisoli]|uniref:helicase-exonuclease AddAB subunit AddA n=1 Tax=Brevibacillus ginsengisoli TaxID=363854 RepID=UPI003CF7ABA4
MTANQTKPEQWTDEQWEAIIARGQNLLVAAAAGSGKTSVLVERIIRRILDDHDPIGVDQLLVVTFTNAAAAEMRHRIGDALRKALEENPVSHHVRKQLSMLQRATITTIHSFCLNLLRQYYYMVDLDPNFRIADPLEMELIRQDVLEEQLEKWYASDDEFVTLADVMVEGQDDAGLATLLLKLYEFSRSHPEPSRWLQEAAGMFQIEADTSIAELPWTSSITASIQLQLQATQAHLEKALRLAGSTEGPQAYVPLLEKEHQAVQAAQAASESGWEAMEASIRAITFGRLPGVKDADPLVKEQVQALRNGVKDRVKKLVEEYFSTDTAQYRADILQMAPVLGTLARLVIQFDEAYQAEKRSRAIVDFGDLEHLALQILVEHQADEPGSCPSSIALQLREQFAEVLVDEYQDINLVQETILQMVSRDVETNGVSNRFMVGDVKQSIYRFRLAEPKLFLQKYSTYSRKQDWGSFAHSDSQSDGHRIDLAANFRSRQEVVDAVNYVFRQIMTPRVGELTYDRSAELIGRARYPEVDSEQLSVELHLIDRSKITDDSLEADSFPLETMEESSSEQADQQVNEQEEASVAQLEARLIAKRIHQWMEPGEGGKPLLVFDKKEGGLRPLAYRDIVILLRATAGWAQPMLEEFRAMGIPVHAEQSDGYFSATEVEVMMSLLRVIDNPKQDIPLTAVLRSPIVGLREERLAQIRVAYPSIPFYQAVELFKSEESDKEFGWLWILRRFYEMLHQWRTRARQGSLADLIALIYRETGYQDYVTSLENGAQRNANLQALYDRARQYEATSYRGLFRFLRFIDRLKERGSDLGEARIVGENENVVRIMTIHKSKGLEFPVVFVAGLGKQFNTMDLKSKFLLHKDLGFGAQVMDSSLRLRYPSLSYLGIRERMRTELLAEEMRVLYVALTRAREKLLLVGSLKDLTKSLSQWCDQTGDKESLADEELMNAKGYLDWLGRSVVRHPDGALLRERFKELGHELMVRMVPDDSRWQVVIRQAQEFSAQNISQAPNEGTWRQLTQLVPIEGRPEDIHWRSVIEQRLAWQYPFERSTQLAAKWTVTELKRLEQDKSSRENELAEQVDHKPSYKGSPFQKLQVTKLTNKPKFLARNDEMIDRSTNNRKITPFTRAEVGTFTHLVMQHLDLTGELSQSDVANQISRLVERQFLTEEQASCLDIGKIVRFFETELGQTMKNAPWVYRELPFTMAVSAKEVIEDEWLTDQSEGDQIIVQGVLDCLIEHDDGTLTLVDYKTDAIEGELTADLIRSLEARYHKQVQSYIRAIERIWRRKVSSSYLYYFDRDLLVQVNRG